MRNLRCNLASHDTGIKKTSSDLFLAVLLLELTSQTSSIDVTALTELHHP